MSNPLHLDPPVTQPPAPDASEPHSSEREPPELKAKEPIFNVPPVVVATVVVLLAVHAVRTLALTAAQDEYVLLAFSFIPARYDVDPFTSAALPGGFGADLWSFFSYAFLHADSVHIGLNLAW